MAAQQVSTWTLDFGTVNNSSTHGAPVITLGLTNDTSGPSDTLAGTFPQAGDSFHYGNLNAFSGLDAGQTLTSYEVTLDNKENGRFSGTITLSGASQNSSGYDGGLGDFVINITGTVVPEPSAAAMLLLGLAAGARVRRNRRGLTDPASSPTRGVGIFKKRGQVPVDVRTHLREEAAAFLPQNLCPILPQLPPIPILPFNGW